jgi:2-dehydropantoate 2-reductase
MLGVTTQGATLAGPGCVRSGGAGPTHVAGPSWVAQVLADAGMEAHAVAPAEIQPLAWGKLAVNCAINPLTALLRVPNGELLEQASTCRLMDQAAGECAAVAAAKGIELPYPDAAAKAREVARLTASNRSSMLQDVLRGAPTEVDAINGAVVAAGRETGVASPVNEVLWHLVRAAVQAKHHANACYYR